MKNLLKTSLVIMLILSSGRASGQYFVSTVNDIGGFVGFPCFIKLETGEEINGLFQAIILMKYQIKTDGGKKIKIKPREISSISFDVSNNKTYVWALTNESRTQIHKNKELARKDTFIFENIEGKGLLQWLNPGFVGKIKVYACDVGYANLVKDEEEINGSMKYVIIRENAKPVVIDNSNFRETLKEVFSDCPKMLSGFFDEQMRWDDIGRHVFMYDQLCK
jgi:ABC-type antimicrobial peptide transport system permease subunit